MHQKRNVIGRLLIVVSIGFILNYVWEIAQMPAYTNGRGDAFEGSLRFRMRHCLVPALGDASLVGFAYLIAAALSSTRFGRISDSDWRAALLVSPLLTGMAVLGERVAVHRLHLWGYNRWMPIVPWLNVGLLPLVQLPLLTLLTFVIANRLLWRHES